MADVRLMQVQDATQYVVYDTLALELVEVFV